MSTSTAAETVNAKPVGKGWTIGLWVAQALLGLAFGMAGATKTLTPIEDLAQNMAWVSSVPPELVRFNGVSEFLGGLGLILPAATRIRPMLTPIAALGLVVIMVLAAGFHVTRGEGPAVAINFVLGGLAAFVAWGRLRKAPIEPRA